MSGLVTLRLRGPAVVVDKNIDHPQRNGRVIIGLVAFFAAFARLHVPIIVREDEEHTVILTRKGLVVACPDTHIRCHPTHAQTER